MLQVLLRDIAADVQYIVTLCRAGRVILFVQQAAHVERPGRAYAARESFPQRQLLQSEMARLRQSPSQDLYRDSAMDLPASACARVCVYYAR